MIVSTLIALSFLHPLVARAEESKDNKGTKGTIGIICRLDNGLVVDYEQTSRRAEYVRCLEIALTSMGFNVREMPVDSLVEGLTEVNVIRDRMPMPYPYYATDESPNSSQK